jgi:4-amino-4-deoxy-L-arabinose transferase-like glycosyltransferase
MTATLRIARAPLGGLIVASLLLVGLILRIAFLGQPDPFRDEAASWLLASYPLGQLIRHTAQEPYSPLYPLVLKASMALFGDGLAAIRMPSVLAGLATFLVGWRWARDALGPRAGIVAAGMLALSPMAVLEARDARMYALETAFATAAWWLAWTTAARPRSSGHAYRVIALAVAVGGEMWVDPYGIVAAGLQFLAVTYCWRVRIGHGARAAAVGIGFGMVTFVPWAAQLLSSSVVRAPFWTPRPGLAALANAYGAWIGGTGSTLALVATPLVVVAAATGIVSLVRSGIDSERAYGFLIVAALGEPVIVWVGSQFHPAFDARYLGSILAPTAGAAAAGFRAVLRRTKAVAQIQRSVSALLILAVACLGIGAATTVQRWATGVEVAPVSEVVQVLLQKAHPGDMIVAVDSRSYFPLAYVLRRPSETAGRSIPLYSWGGPTEPASWGAALIPTAARLRPPIDFASLLGPGARVWLVALANGDASALGFGPLDSGVFVQVWSTVIQPGDRAVQIRELIVNRASGS